ncbi:hypothetical protein NpPPO83_00012006 [Neofusicoccum parvum]|uniref:Uncharacterized protein n=1 Tax=Neofusicoccum parvum TaxID=310453 RepID=A0ACB5SH04_9PEZI|nr:hypothetical protein NpPPO83_00012006 [Neofusicoccum parvum]
MKSSRDHKRQLQRLKTTAPTYTLDPDQGPSPITPTGRTMPPLAPPARPLGPRTQPDRGDERRSQRDPFERVRAATAEPPLPPLPSPSPIDSGKQQRRRRTPTGWESRAPRAPGLPPCTAAAAAPRTASPVSESVWDDVDELTRELRERNRLDRQRSRLREEAELRLRREISAFPVRGGREATAAEETGGSGAGEDGAWHPQPARRFPWTSLRSSRSKSRSRE